MLTEGNYDGGCNERLIQTPDRYKDIGELMKRCETLVVTRDDAKRALRSFQDEIAGEEKELASFKEAQNERILNLRYDFSACQDLEQLYFELIFKLCAVLCIPAIPAM